MTVAEQLVAALQAKGLWLAVAESLTGGALSAELVSAPGASKVFIGGVVVYQDELKSGLLGVSRALIENQGAVDAEVAAQMADQVREKLARQAGIDVSRVIGLSTTGEAGPVANSSAAVGTVFIGLTMPIGNGMGETGGIAETQVFAHHFDGDRAQIRAAAVDTALQALLETIGNATSR